MWTSMVYPAYLLCLALIVPAFALTALVGTIMLLATGPKQGWSVLLNCLAFFGAGVAEPLRYGWRIAALLGTLGFLLGAGAIPGLRVHAFHGLAVLATLCVTFCFYAAARQDAQNVLNALIVLWPSLFGIGACLWFATKFKGLTYK